MSAGTFRKQPAEIEAIRWTGKNTGEVKAWMMSRYMADSGTKEDAPIALFVKRRASGMTETLFSNVLVNPSPEVTAAIWVAANGAYLGIINGEWILKDHLGFYPAHDRGDGLAPVNYEPSEAHA